MMCRSHLRIAVLVLCASAAFQPARTEAQDPLWGGELIEKIDSLVALNLADGSFASVSVGVKKGSDLLLAKGYGFANLEHSVPAGAETVYRLGSLTKQFTAAAVMQLIERGEMSLEDDMTDYLPDYPMQGHSVTIAHLLNHTSGIRSYTGVEAWYPKMPLPLTDDELISYIVEEPFDFAPGAEYRYNNSGYYLLGMVLDSVSDLSYADYLEATLFEPFGLSGTSYCDQRRLIPNRAAGYDFVDGELVNTEYLNMNHPGGGGALCSTVLDLLAWSAALRDGRVISELSYEAMTTPLPLNDGNPAPYGFGIRPSTRMEGHRSIWHGGGVNGFNTRLDYYPDADLDIVVLSNTPGGHVGRITDMIARWALGIPVPSVADMQLGTAELAIYEGVYRLGNGPELSFFASDGKLFMQPAGQAPTQLRAQGDHAFIPVANEYTQYIFEVEGDRAIDMHVFQCVPTDHERCRTVEGERVR